MIIYYEQSNISSSLKNFVAIDSASTRPRPLTLKFIYILHNLCYTKQQIDIVIKVICIGGRQIIYLVNWVWLHIISTLNTSRFKDLLYHHNSANPNPEKIFILGFHDREEDEKKTTIYFKFYHFSTVKNIKNESLVIISIIWYWTV